MSDDEEEFFSEEEDESDHDAINFGNLPAQPVQVETPQPEPVQVAQVQHTPLQHVKPALPVDEIMRTVFTKVGQGRDSVEVAALVMGINTNGDVRHLRHKTDFNNEEDAFLTYVGTLKHDDMSLITFQEFLSMEPRRYSDPSVSTDTDTSSLTLTEPTPKPSPKKVRTQPVARRSHSTDTQQQSRVAFGRSVPPESSITRSRTSTHSPSPVSRSNSGSRVISPLVPQSARAAQLEAKRRALKELNRKKARKFHGAHDLQPAQEVPQPHPHQSHPRAATPTSVDRHRSTSPQKQQLLSPAPVDTDTDTFLALLRDRLTSPQRSPSVGVPDQTTEIICLQTFIAQQREIIRSLEERLEDAEDDAKAAEKREHKAVKKERKAVEQQTLLENKLLQMSNPKVLRKLLRKQGVDMEEKAKPTGEVFSKEDVEAEVQQAVTKVEQEMTEMMEDVTRERDAERVGLVREAEEREEMWKGREEVWKKQEKEWVEKEKGLLLEVEELQEKVEGMQAEMHVVNKAVEVAKKEGKEQKNKSARAAEDHTSATRRLEQDAQELSRSLERSETAMTKLRTDLEAMSTTVQQKDAELTRITGVLNLMEKARPGTSSGACSICGSTSNLELRKSGWKCKNCVGKKSKK